MLKKTKQWNFCKISEEFQEIAGEVFDKPGKCKHYFLKKILEDMKSFFIEIGGFLGKNIWKERTIGNFPKIFVIDFQVDSQRMFMINKK